MKNRLRSLGCVSVAPPEKPFDPKKFFRNRKGFIHSDEFYEHFLSQCSKNKDAKKVRLAFFDLIDPSYDHQIKKELPKGSSAVALWQIAYLIKQQWNGEAGPLLCGEKDYNIFYEGEYVLALGRSKERGWGLGTLHTDQTDFWPRNTRIFIVS